MKIDFLSNEEQISIKLRDLYQSLGYLPYKVSHFEEIEYYIRNKDFLVSNQILTFSDANGKLMALKPDITLSIVRSLSDKNVPVKVSYAENAYRVPRGEDGFKEIMQCGLEYFGAINVYVLSEILVLAAKSLELISDQYVLDISDMGILMGILIGEKLIDDERKALLHLISQRNPHQLAEMCRHLHVSEVSTELLLKIVRLYGPIEEKLEVLEKLELPAACFESLEMLKKINRTVKKFGDYHINLDFSVVNDMSYYNGLIFNGFILGIPNSILSGGRYDPLIQKNGKQGGAVGFAVYLDQLELLQIQKISKPTDVVLLCETNASIEKIIEIVKENEAQGKSVSVIYNEKAPSHCGTVIHLKAEENQS